MLTHAPPKRLINTRAVGERYGGRHPRTVKRWCAAGCNSRRPIRPSTIAITGTSRRSIVTTASASSTAPNNENAPGEGGASVAGLATSQWRKPCPRYSRSTHKSRSNLQDAIAIFNARVDAVTACGLALMYPGTEINLIDQKSQPPAKIVVPSGFQRAGSVRNRINGLAKKLALHF